MLFAVIVHAGVEEETASLIRLPDGPASETPCDFRDILLGVAAVDAEGVEFH